MQLKTILNRLQRHKSFVYQEGKFTEEDGRTAIEVQVQPRANGRPICSGCGRRCAGYDRLPARRFQFVPLWGLAVYLVYRLRRVECGQCGVKVEAVPWAQGKQPQTLAFQWFLVFWAKLLAWQQVARVFHTSWHVVYSAVSTAVEWGLARRCLEDVKAIGIDEIAWQKGHKYLTLVYQIEAHCKRLLYVALARTADSLRGFFQTVGSGLAAGLRYVCSDMWQPYLEVLAAEAGQAVHVLDRYHIMAKMNNAIDEVRAAEARRLKADGYEQVLKHSRWCLLKRPENLTAKQTVKLAELLRYNLRTVRAYLQREEFQRFWEYRSPHWAGQFLREWCTRVLRSGIEPMKKIARTLRGHAPLILNWFRAKGTISAGVVEGLNYNAKLTMKKAYGFRTFNAVEMALYHRLGALPESDLAHRFI